MIGWRGARRPVPTHKNPIAVLFSTSGNPCSLARDGIFDDVLYEFMRKRRRQRLDPGDGVDFEVFELLGIILDSDEPFFCRKPFEGLEDVWKIFVGRVDQ